MSDLKLKSNAPGFTLLNQDGEKVSLSGLSGKWVVLYFYPKDNTSGCTLEAINFTERLPDFQAAGAVVLGVSPDSVKSHGNFCMKHDLGITLLSDPDHDVLGAYGVWQLKKMYGREYYGVVRSTFIIDPAGILVHAWSRVKVKGHVDEVFSTLERLQTGAS